MAAIEKKTPAPTPFRRRPSLPSSLPLPLNSRCQPHRFPLPVFKIHCFKSNQSLHVMNTIDSLSNVFQGTY